MITQTQNNTLTQRTNPLSMPGINNPRMGGSMRALPMINRPLTGGSLGSADNSGGMFRRPTPQFMSGASVGGVGNVLGQSRAPINLASGATIGSMGPVMMQMLQKRLQKESR